MTMPKSFLLLCFAVLATVSCGKSDSILRVNMPPIETVPVSHINAHVTVAAEARDIDVHSPDGTPFSMLAGSSFTVEIDSKYSGAVGVELTVYDEANEPFLTGLASLDDLDVGEVNDVVIGWL